MQIGSVFHFLDENVAGIDFTRYVANGHHFIVVEFVNLVFTKVDVYLAPLLVVDIDRWTQSASLL